MELAADHPGVVGQLDNLDQLAVRRVAGDDETSLLQDRSIAIVELPAVSVALVDALFAVRAPGATVQVEPARIGPEPHRSTLLRYPPLRFQEVDHRMRRGRVELGAVGAGQAGDIAGKLDGQDLQSKA